MFPEPEKNRKSTHEQSDGKHDRWQADERSEKQKGENRHIETDRQKRPEERVDEEES